MNGQKAVFLNLRGNTDTVTWRLLNLYLKANKYNSRQGYRDDNGQVFRCLRDISGNNQTEAANFAGEYI